MTVEDRLLAGAVLRAESQTNESRRLNTVSETLLSWLRRGCGVKPSRSGARTRLEAAGVPYAGRAPFGCHRAAKVTAPAASGLLAARPIEVRALRAIHPRRVA